MSLAKAARSMNAALEALRIGDSASRPHVFISYARPDRALVLALVEVLARRGFASWWDDEVRAGDHFEAKIVAALDAASAVLVLWSPQSIVSAWVKWEASRGLKQGKLVPVAVPNLDLRDIRPPFSDLNTLGLEDDTRILAALNALNTGRHGA